MSQVCWRGLAAPCNLQGESGAEHPRASVLFLMEGCLHGAGRMLLVAFHKCAFCKILGLAQVWFGFPEHLCGAGSVALVSSDVLALECYKCQMIGSSQL